MIEELQLRFMVMIGSHDPHEDPKPSKIRFFAHHAPLKIIFIHASSPQKTSHVTDVSMSSFFHPLSTDMHPPL